MRYTFLDETCIFFVKICVPVSLNHLYFVKADIRDRLLIFMHELNRRLFTCIGQFAGVVDRPHGIQPKWTTSRLIIRENSEYRVTLAQSQSFNLALTTISEPFRIYRLY